MMVGHASGVREGDETPGVPMVVGHTYPASTAGLTGDLATRPVTSDLPVAEPASIIDDMVDEWGRQSFPASDPPSNR
jgi:hypothetical protein